MQLSLRITNKWILDVQMWDNDSERLFFCYLPYAVYINNVISIFVPFNLRYETRVKLSGQS